MCVKYLLLFIIVSPYSEGVYETDHESLEFSNLPFRYELEQVANEFQEELRKELSLLEMDMYNEFLNLTREIESSQRNLTEGLTGELSEKVSGVMSKFKKVMTYSTERTQVLNDKMEEMMVSLRNWVEKGLGPAASQRRRRHLQSRKMGIQPDKTDRTKRHTSSIVAGEDVFFQDVSEAKKLLELEPEDFPIVDDISEIDTLLDISNYFDGDLENHDSDFTLREFVKGTTSRYTVEKEQPKRSLESVPRKKVLPSNCYDLLQEGNTQNGVYVIYPSGKGGGLKVWCDQESVGGGWTAIVNRRADKPRLNFTTTPTQYAHGFGIPSSNHWIGLEVMHELTRGRSHALRVHLQDHDGNEAYAHYDTFRVGSRDEEDYSLEVGGYDDDKSSAGDALNDHSGRPFVFPLPESGESCSHTLGVGWWYLEEPLCYQALATGHHRQINDEEGSSDIEWTPWTGSGQALQSLSFMIRPSNV